MCILLIAKHPVPGIELAILHNRDEFTNRPFTYAELRTSDAGSLIYAKDLVADGTWLAVDDSGNFSAVLNIRVSPDRDQKPKSRGELPLLALEHKDGFKEFVDGITAHTSDYGAFTTVLGGKDRKTEVFSSTDQAYVETDSDCYAISNNSVSQSWKKPQAFENLFKQHVQGRSLTLEKFVHQSFTILEDRTLLDPRDLPVTEFPEETELKLSSQFVYLPESKYQTVVSTVVVVPTGKPPVFYEKNHLDRSHGMREIGF